MTNEGAFNVQKTVVRTNPQVSLSNRTQSQQLIEKFLKEVDQAEMSSDINEVRAAILSDQNVGCYSYTPASSTTSIEEEKDRRQNLPSLKEDKFYDDPDWEMSSERGSTPDRTERC